MFKISAVSFEGNCDSGQMEREMSDLLRQRPFFPRFRARENPQLEAPRLDSEPFAHR